MVFLEIWPGSRLVLERVSGGEPVLHGFPDPFVLYFLLCLTVLAIIIYERIAEALIVSVKTLVGGGNLKNIQSIKHKNDSVTLSFLLIVPFYAFVFLHTGQASLSYWWILCTLAAYFLYREIMFKVLSWAVGKRETFADAAKAGRSAFFLMAVFSLPSLLVEYFIDTGASETMALYVLVVAIVLLFIYFVRIFKIFIHSELSCFFRILYLCALEILPMLVVVKAVFFD